MNFPAISQLMILNRRRGGRGGLVLPTNKIIMIMPIYIYIYIYIYMLSLGQDPIT